MENIRIESFLGNDKVIVGNKYADLVLETLGKVYVKTGNSSVVLNDVFKLLNQTSESDIKSLAIIVGNTLEMELMEYPGDGFFIYNTLTTTLYISYDLRYIALIEAAEGAGDGYVRRRGDTMTGQLEINTVGPPLIVASSKLILNLNAEYLNGYSSDDLAKKKIDEYIYGNWTFKGTGTSENNWIFKNNVRMYGDLVTSKSITSPEFASGFGGYGWRLDSDTNTLTVDYLVVRKAMKVYEMVINKISATNGSIWVSNSSKCSEAVQPIILTDTLLKSIQPWLGTDADKLAALNIIKTNNYYIPLPDNGANTESTLTLSTELSGPSELNTTTKTFTNYKFIIYIKDANKLVNSPLFLGLLSLYDEALLTSTSTELDYVNLRLYITLYYISKEVVVTEWGGNEGQWDEGTEPIKWEYLDTFNKKTAFYIIPKGTDSSGRLYTDIYENATSLENAQSCTFAIYPYYKYFAAEQTLVDNAIKESNSGYTNGSTPTVLFPNLWVVNTDDDEYPLFKAGDIIRCQKYTNGNIKYYDAIVLSLIDTRQFIVQKAVSVFDIYTEIHYNEDGSVNSYTQEYNNTQYNKTEQSYDASTGISKINSSSKTTEARVDDIASGDDMIQMGNIYDVQRQNAIYLTSCDDDGPFIDVISGLNRPDYSVLYDTPIYVRCDYIFTSSDVLFKYNGIKYKYYIQETLPTDVFYVYPIVYNDTNYYGTLYPTRQSLLDTSGNLFRHAYTKTTRVRVGNLDGIYNEVFKTKQPYGFGLYGENVFLTGEFYLNNGQSVVEFAQDSINMAVSSIEVGGANLVSDSKKELTSTEYGFASANVALEKDKAYVFLINGYCSLKALDEGHYLRSYLYLPDWSYSVYVDINSTTAESKYVKFTAPKSGNYLITSYLYPSGGTRTGTVTLNWYKVEIGTIPTDWTPDYDDINKVLKEYSAKFEITDLSISSVVSEVDKINNRIDTAGWITEADGNKLWASSAETAEATENAKKALEDAAKAIADASSALIISNQADKTADEAKDSATTSATWISNNKDRIELISGQFDADGNLTNTSGLVTGNGTFSTLFANAVDADNNIVKQADITVFVTKDEMNNAISNISITADKIKLEGYTTINKGFSIDKLGSMTATSGLIAGFSISNNSLSSYTSNNKNYIEITPGTISTLTTESLYEGTVTYNCNIGGTYSILGLTFGNAIWATFNSTNMPISITNPCVALYLSASGAHKYVDVPLSGNNALYIREGFISGLRLNVKVVTTLHDTLDSDKYYTLSSMDTYVYITEGVTGVNLPSNPQEGLMYMIRKGNTNGSVYVRAKGNTLILVGEGTQSSNYTTLTGFDYSKIGFLVYTNTRTWDNKGIWFFNLWN